MHSAIPKSYYLIFAVYEPLLTVVGFFLALADPKGTHDAQAPWPMGQAPLEALPRATIVTVMQLAHVCGLVGIINLFVLTAARKHLATQPAIQEKVVRALLTPLLFGDVMHLVVTIWALGDSKWDMQTWTPLLWTTLIMGLALMVPRIAWHIGIGRYVHRRDGGSSGIKRT